MEKWITRILKTDAELVHAWWRQGTRPCGFCANIWGSKTVKVHFEVGWCHGMLPEESVPRGNTLFVATNFIIVLRYSILIRHWLLRQALFVSSSSAKDSSQKGLFHHGLTGNEQRRRKCWNETIGGYVLIKDTFAWSHWLINKKIRHTTTTWSPIPPPFTAH